ncbi:MULTISPECIES: DNA methylase [unclassified Fusibacter]|uniref:Y-family DNA polymerase n=1 Tax=unclassified Fusibacter TaxID=2624464 RepID=UPI001011F91A|nr:MULTISPECIES: DNA methylase [unclassified Fusibacter]MCK8061473.1 DNA methylase [Fusibacter sp. A2]NPE23658.1 DNA methylase [Fusibacter sp. A1]RXV58837.1 DNA methylase [Fusibacter sp. A1]
MNENNRIYVAIDLKSFYASVECIERGLDPLTTNLVVADASRSEKTICLAVSPSLKRFGISGRARLFEVVQKVKEANAKRRRYAPNWQFNGSSYFSDELEKSADLAIDYIAAPPRMAFYMDYSTRIYNVYLKHVAPEDIHVYSIDEVFIDVTHYLTSTQLSPREFAKRLIKDVLDTVGVTATAGIGTNLYLCKVAMDIVAKHIPADRDGVRIAEIDERSYRELLWTHKPLTDFWRVGRGYQKKLHDNSLFTMGDIARCSLDNEDLLYKLFGVNAQLLIDHAWGYEPCTIEDVRSYKPSSKSTGAGQVLHNPYPYESARIIVQEMTDLLVLDLVEKGLVTDQMVLTVGYDISNLATAELRDAFHGEVKTDYYGRQVPKHAHGTVNLKKMTSSTKLIMDAVMGLFDEIVDPNLYVRRVNIVAGRIKDEKKAQNEATYEQLDIFTDYEAKIAKEEAEEEALKKEKNLQHAILDLKKKFGKNAVLKGMNLQEDANTKERNKQIGGHKA